MLELLQRPVKLELRGTTMQITELGRKAIASKECRSDFLTLAVTHLFHHKTPLPEFEDGLRHIVAEFLAAVPYRGGFRPAMRNFPPLRIDELCGLEEFLVEHAALIEPIVQEAIEGAKAVHKAME